MRTICVVAICVVALLVGAGVLLAGGAGPDPLAPLWAELVSGLGQMLALLLGALVTWLVATLRKKAGIEVSAAHEAYLHDLACAGVLRAEEWAARQAATGAGVGGSVKLRRALEYVLERAPGVSSHEAEELVDAALPELGLGAAAVIRAARSEESPGEAGGEE